MAFDRKLVIVIEWINLGRARQNITEFTQDWYGYDYFANPEGIEFVLSDGSTKRWGYKNIEGGYNGAEEVVKAWKTLFSPKRVLEFGAGRGQFLAYCREQDVDAVGFDWSEYATGKEGRFKRCKSEWLKCLDATEPWPYPSNSFDLVIGLDIMEHIYLEDLPFVIEEIYRVASKWVFLQIATVDGVREQGYVLKKGEPIPLATDGRTWAGHTTVLTEADWIDKFEHDYWMPRRDLVNWFCALVNPSIINNWLLNSILVLGKIE